MNPAYDPQAWSVFFAAEAGAAAALTGLMIVAISINIQRIIASQLLSGRAAETILLLSGVLILTTFGMVPAQGALAFGLECLGVGTATLLATGYILFRARSVRHPREWRWIRRVFNLGGSLPVLIAGASLLAGQGGGLYWLVPGVLMALLGGILNSWVLLVEILR